MCNLVLTFRSEIGTVPFIKVVLNLKIAVYCTGRLNTLYLLTSCSRRNFKVLYKCWFNPGFVYSVVVVVVVIYALLTAK
jgi:hypothetical protein